MNSSGAIWAPFQKFNTVSMDLMEMRLKNNNFDDTESHSLKKSNIQRSWIIYEQEKKIQKNM